MRLASPPPFRLIFPSDSDRRGTGNPFLYCGSTFVPIEREATVREVTMTEGPKSALAVSLLGKIDDGGQARTLFLGDDLKSAIRSLEAASFAIVEPQVGVTLRPVASLPASDRLARGDVNIEHGDGDGV